MLTMAFLEQRLTSYGPGLLTAALAPSITLVAIVTTIFVSLAIAQFNSLGAVLLKLTDAGTGKVHGLDAVEYKTAIGDIAQPLAWVIVIVIVVVGILITISHQLDKSRATAAAWKLLYFNAVRPSGPWQFKGRVGHRRVQRMN